MSPKLPVSIIVPCLKSPNITIPLLRNLCSSSYWPSEIIIILSGAVPPLCGSSYASVIKTFPSSFVSAIECCYVPVRLFPGAARNHGIQIAKYPWIAFLDVNTLPTTTWLEESFRVASRCDFGISFGFTLYAGDTFLQRLFMLATYGLHPLRTVPGSLVHIKILNQIGGFLPHIRAGEDTDWMVRVKQFRFIKISHRTPPLNYSAVPASLFELAHKWFRNYRSCAPVVFHLETQKTIYVIVGNLLILLFAFRWNALLAGWQETNIFYVANISKIVFFVLVFLYVVMRGVVMPLRKGATLFDLFPSKWLLVVLVCVVLDLAKLLAFVMPPWRNRSF
jgi:hypothetical protein